MALRKVEGKVSFIMCLMSGSVAVLKIVTWEVEKSAMVYPP